MQNIDFNENIARNLDLNMKKINLKFDFDSSLTCYNLEQKSSFKKMGEFFFNINLALKIEEDDLNLLISSGQNKAGLMHFLGFSIRYYGLD